jgi:hypothetical protein
MEQDIAMLSALMILNLSMDKLMSRTGRMIKATMEAVVHNLISLNQISMPMPILLMCAQFQAITVVRVRNVEMAKRDNRATVIRMDVTSTLLEMEIENSSVQAQIFQSILQSLSRS